MSCKGYKDGNGCDRLSSLPEPVLHYILSFIPTKYVVQMSLLSSKWRYLWNSIPSLSVDEISFRSSNMKRLQKKEIRNFMDFVDRVLMLRDGSNLHKFRLSFGHSCDPCRAENWMRYAKKRSVRELDFSIYVGSMPDLAGPLFTCEWLREMKLDLHGCLLCLPAFVNLPNLKALHLVSLQLSETRGSFRELLARSPRLESLTMDKCRFVGIDVVEFTGCSFLEILSMNNCKIFGVVTLTISACKLKSLIMDKCRGLGSCKVNISAPNLRSFKYTSDIALAFSVENLSAPLDAVVDFFYPGSYWDKRQHQNSDGKDSPLSKGSPLAEIALLRGLEKATSLSLSAPSVVLLLGGTKLLTSFTNLKYLKLSANELNSGHVTYVQVMTCFLKCSPNLETFIIEDLQKHEDDGGCLEVVEFPVDCMLYHLKEVHIRNFNGSKSSLALVKFILKNATMLERVIFIPYKMRCGLRRQKKISQELLMFPRASSTIAFLFS